ncbi:MAG: type I glyceraldehyde-3-phosphate dehydrogenase [Nanoarchaeota archaeon]
MKVAINGFGRIGRSFFKIAFDKGIDIVAINDIHGVEDAAYLLKYDSVYGKYKYNVSVGKDSILVNGKKIIVLNNREPLNLPWKKLGVDVVIESTGVFRDRTGASKHIKAGAKYVLVSAPTKGESDITLVPGVNDKKLEKKHSIISVASCTTNCLAPIVKVLHQNFVVENGFMTTIHAYTSSQALVDDSHNKPTRGRAAALNIVPTTSGATEAVEEVIPEMKGKINGLAIRVPVACGSITDFVATLRKKTNAKEINSIFRKVSQGELKGIIEYSEEDLVSSDIIGNPHSAIISAKNTQVNKNMVKILAWYDNEYGYSNRVVDVIKMLEKWVK